MAGVTKILFEFGGNIEDASMTRLGGEFSMMLVTGLPASVSSAKLDKAFGALGKKLKLVIAAKPISPSEAHRSKRHDQVLQSSALESGGAV